ncbi:MAG: hypothetical protein HYZ94_03625 [Candidatus Omnitrophica bacterium]|nr:hypothetical protein [Candidatus Omnitrophota bacterium]
MKPQTEPQGAQAKQVHRVVTFLDRSQVDYLDKMGKDALFSTGVKFPRTRIISALIDLLRKVNVSGEGLRSDQDLEERLLKKLASGSPDGKRLAGELSEGNREASARVRG